MRTLATQQTTQSWERGLLEAVEELLPELLALPEVLVQRPIRADMGLRCLLTSAE
ncbi:MAG TPA: hypothetical protein PLT48_01360 [Nitrospira sp.]|nr:hypothetical protein [Nitrospira sp.]